MKKAIRIIAAAVAKLRGNRVYEFIEIDMTKKVLVIGGGIGVQGMSAG